MIKHVRTQSCSVKKKQKKKLDKNPHIKQIAGVDEASLKSWSQVQSVMSGPMPVKTVKWGHPAGDV